MQCIENLLKLTLFADTSLTLHDVEPFFLSNLLLLFAMPFEFIPELDAPRSTSHARGVYGTRPVRVCNSSRRNEKSGKI